MIRTPIRVGGIARADRSTGARLSSYRIGAASWIVENLIHAIQRSTSGEGVASAGRSGLSRKDEIDVAHGLKPLVDRLGFCRPVLMRISGFRRRRGPGAAAGRARGSGKSSKSVSVQRVWMISFDCRSRRDRRRHTRHGARTQRRYQDSHGRKLASDRSSDMAGTRTCIRPGTTHRLSLSLRSIHSASVAVDAGAADLEP